MAFPIQPLGSLPGKTSAAEKKIAEKTEEVVTGANYLAATLAAQHAALDALTARVAALETAEPSEPEPVPEPADGAVASVSVSAPSQIQVGTTAQLAFVAKDAAGNVVVRPPYTFAVDNPAVATVASNGTITGVSAGNYAISVTVEGVTGSATGSVVAVAPTPVPTPTPIPTPDDVATILARLGPTKSLAETAALGGAFKRYDEVFTQYLPPASTDAWGNNYYDRVVVFLARYARGGDPALVQRAFTILLDYRKTYLEANNYGTSPHWAQVRGLELHYLLTGDEASRTAVGGVALTMVRGYGTSYIGNTSHSNADARIQARTLQAALAAYRLDVGFRRADGAQILATEWPTRLRAMLDLVLSTQNADGSCSWAQICGGQLNYMQGMLNDVLIEYYRDFEPDPRIPTSIEKSNEYLWSSQWLTASKAFKYASVQCSPNPWGVNVGGPSPAPDLNGLIIASFGWLGKETGNPVWFQRGDEIMAGLVNTTNYTGSKQFNQGFSEAYRYLGWR